MPGKKVAARINEIIHNQPLSVALARSIEMGLDQPFVHLTGRTVWQVFQYSLQAAIRDIENHPRGKLFRRFIEYGPPNPDDPKLLTSDGETVLSDPECGQCVQFIFSHMVNRFKGELAELLSIAPSLSLVRQLQQDGRLPDDIELYFGETIAERRQVGHLDAKHWGGFGKGSDGLIVERMPADSQVLNPVITVCGLLEVKSMPQPEAKLLAQLNHHLERLRGGVKLAGVEWGANQVAAQAPFFITVIPSTWKLSREWQRQDTEDGWELILPQASQPPVTTRCEQDLQGHWSVTLDWSKEALEQAAYEMTFWYMSQVGKAIYTRKPLPKEWEGMSPEAAGYNSIKMMLYYVILRYISPRQGQRAIKLYNTYCFGYPLALEAEDMLWPEDFDEGKQGET